MEDLHNMILAPMFASFQLTKQHPGHEEMGLAQQEIAAMEGALAELNKSYLVWIQGFQLSATLCLLRLGGEGGRIQRATRGPGPMEFMFKDTLRSATILTSS